MSTDDTPPSPWQSCTCGHLAAHHEADEHGMRDICCVEIVTPPPEMTHVGQCPCRQFERWGRPTLAAPREWEYEVR